jgi:hypothetical protein
VTNHDDDADRGRLLPTSRAGASRCAPSFDPEHIRSVVPKLYTAGLEINESPIMQDIETNTQKLRAVRDLGVDVVDFGTGYSSLA